MLRLSQPPYVYYLKCICWKINLIKLSRTQLSPSSCHFFSLSLFKCSSVPGPQVPSVPGPHVPSTYATIFSVRKYVLQPYTKKVFNFYSKTN